MAGITLTNLAGYTWGIASAETGINVEKLTVKASGEKYEQKDFQGRFVGRVDYGIKQHYTITGALTAAYTPAIGALVTLTNAMTLGGESAGANFLEDVEISYENNKPAMITINTTRYEDIASTVTQTTL